ncbi:MAG: hypothetical protein QNJ69_04230 [Gammaproteobacteria bacterium]|nr:hypothetical protein [Gammaproteobacteria bacterium]
MIRTYSQRMMPPYSGQVQIAESDRARALTVDGESWEFQFRKTTSSTLTQTGQKVHTSYTRAAYIKHSELSDFTRDSSVEGREVDERIAELAEFLVDASLPFPAVDIYEYWLLDGTDGSPLALIFSCTHSDQMDMYPDKPEWTALPAAVLPIEPTQDETDRSDSPVNYRLERLVAERAGQKPQAKWFTRSSHEDTAFPPLMLKEDWQEPAHQDLCQRYINRLSTRLLMLHGLGHEDRLRMEQAAKAYVFEVERFYPLYPEVADKTMMSAIRVEAQLRRSAETEKESSLHDRRDGVLYQ